MFSPLRSSLIHTVRRHVSISYLNEKDIFYKALNALNKPDIEDEVTDRELTDRRVVFLREALLHACCRLPTDLPFKGTTQFYNEEANFLNCARQLTENKSSEWTRGATYLAISVYIAYKGLDAFNGDAINIEGFEAFCLENHIPEERVREINKSYINELVLGVTDADKFVITSSKFKEFFIVSQLSENLRKDVNPERAGKPSLVTRSGGKTSPVEALPDEVLVNIFSHLKTTGNKARASSVSSTFHAVMEESSLKFKEGKLLRQGILQQDKYKIIDALKQGAIPDDYNQTVMTIDCPADCNHSNPIDHAFLYPEETGNPHTLLALLIEAEEWDLANTFVANGAKLPEPDIKYHGVQSLNDGYDEYSYPDLNELYLIFKRNPGLLNKVGENGKTFLHHAIAERLKNLGSEAEDYMDKYYGGSQLIRFFDFIFTFPELDLSIKDNDGHTVLEWAKLQGEISPSMKFKIVPYLMMKCAQRGINVD